MNPGAARRRGGSAIIEEAIEKRRKGATVGRREDHRSAERPLSHPGAVHAGRRRRERVRAAGHGGRRPLPLRPLQEQAVLRRHPPRGRVPGGHASRAAGGVLGERPPSAIRYTFRSWKPAACPPSFAPFSTPPPTPIRSTGWSSSRPTSHTYCWPASTST